MSSRSRGHVIQGKNDWRDRQSKKW